MRIARDAIKVVNHLTAYTRQSPAGYILECTRVMLLSVVIYSAYSCPAFYCKLG